ncbi:MAG: DMT family transporter [Armatimonadetes bacterium]|nr:DMT family transporter [Armatimonadota bacterium]
MSRARAIAYLVISAVLWSTSGLILKSLPSVHWLMVAGLRSLFATIIFLPGLARPRPPVGQLVGAIVCYVVVVSALMGSMQLGTAAQGIWLQYIAPAIVAVYAWLIQRQRIRPVEFAAVLLTIVAVVFIVTGGRGVAHAHSVELGLVSGLAFGAFILLLKTMSDTPPESIFVWTNLGAALIVLPAALASGLALPVGPRELGLVAVMGVFQLGLAYYFFQWGLARTRAVEASLIILLEPILNPIWVYLVVGELPTPRVIFGCALIGTALLAMAVGGNGRNASVERKNGEGSAQTPFPH